MAKPNVKRSVTADVKFSNTPLYEWKTLATKHDTNFGQTDILLMSGNNLSKLLGKKVRLSGSYKSQYGWGESFKLDCRDNGGYLIGGSTFVNVPTSSGTFTINGEVPSDTFKLLLDSSNPATLTNVSLTVVG